MKYEKATAKVILFDNSDVVTASGDDQDPLGFCKYQGNSHHKNCYTTQKYGFQNGSAKIDETYADYWNNW